MQNRRTKMDADNGRAFVNAWLHDVRSPLTMIKGFSEIFSDKKTSKLNSRQQKVMREISNHAGVVFENCNEFASFFRADYLSVISLSIDDLSPNEELLLQENVIKPALASLVIVKEKIEDLLQSGQDDIPEEERESLEMMNAYCLKAIESWKELQDYFNDSNNP